MNKEKKKNIQQANFLEKYPLDSLYFYLTEGCNLACHHCYLAPRFDPDGSKYAMLPLDLFQKAIEEAIPLGLTGAKLTGGEPLLHPDFLAMLEIIHREKLNLSIETNGILCTPEIARKIARLDNPFVSVSLDGANAETHDTIRGVNGAFNKSTSSVKHLAAAGISPQIIMSIMQANVGQIEAVIELAEKLGAASVKFNIIQPAGRGETIHNTANGLEINKLISIGRKIETELIPKTKLQLYFDYPAAFRSLRHIASGDGCMVCSILSILGVLPNGEYALCGMGSHVKELTFGNVTESSLAEIWQDNATLNRLRRGLPGQLTGICSQCLMKNFCLGVCIAQNYYRTLSLWAPFWFCEQANAAGLFPDSRLDLTLNKKTKMI